MDSIWMLILTVLFGSDGGGRLTALAHNFLEIARLVKWPDR